MDLAKQNEELKKMRERFDSNFFGHKIDALIYDQVKAGIADQVKAANASPAEQNDAHRAACEHLEKLSRDTRNMFYKGIFETHLELASETQNQAQPILPLLYKIFNDLLSLRDNGSSALEMVRSAIKLYKQQQEEQQNQQAKQPGWLPAPLIATNGTFNIGWITMDARQQFQHHRTEPKPDLDGSCWVSDIRSIYLMRDTVNLPDYQGKEWLQCKWPVEAVNELVQS